MGRTLMGVVVATVVVYLWGFAYWGMSPVAYWAWNETADDRAAGQALLEHFPEAGVYYIPANGNPPAERSALYESGPTGFVFIDPDGRPEFDAAIMGQGFLLNGVVVVLLAMLLRGTLPAARAYGERLRICALAGLVAVVFVNFGDAVWWALPWNWELAQAFYNFTAVLLMGAILSWFIRPEPGSAVAD